MTVELALDLESGEKLATLPKMEDLLSCLAEPGRRSLHDDYLGMRPELRQSLESIVRKVARETHEQIRVAAYLLFKERERRREWPLYGRELEDWLKAEAALRAQEEQASEEVKAA
jgi:Protein of unknown function (DUF2934)